ncbi:MAG TPA: membrane protein insertase YidC [Geminicoccus sp.]|jgi:YidC/Oxa1 family membrane protein insertase|uniref:membrane protein insertase YidC n=1 Tax=Geminicoccus sp. TaxID=2024832 RepID=UPI002E3163E6|nr:membrane protein insertase YidC [Geminicoccus sp.]HEX2524721.1 membrane protein insertase YidC [Geminicoccus sp.]
MGDQRNLIVAIVFSVAIILGFQYFYELPRLKRAQEQQAQSVEQLAAGLPANQTTATPAVPGSAPAAAAAASEEVPRVRIDNGSLHGTVSLKGGRIDDVKLAQYHETVDPRSPEITLLTPTRGEGAYFAEFGWVPDQAAPVAVPGGDTLWQAEGEQIGAGRPVTLSWENGEGLTFRKSFALDQDFMFTVKRSVTNDTGAPVTLRPYGLLSRWGTPPTLGYYILHEGPIGVFQERLNEPNYSDIVEAPQEFETTGGWLGFTDKYWLTSLVPPQDSQVKATFRHVKDGALDKYQSDYLGAAMTVAPGQTVEMTEHLFVGAKEVNLLDRYSEELNIPLFDRAVDFGWFYFLTKPFFHILNWLYHATGNYGIAILGLTLLVKIVLFPLANKSYKSMSAMKALQPEMEKLRERFSDDRTKMQQELMALYKREKVNPVSGCLPIVVQIPVFFALYKVLFVSIEMRHAPFFGWIHDLSAPDPTTIFNLFGLIPWNPPAFLMIGIWPLIMGATMFIQQKLNPQPPDPLQAKLMQYLPLIFIFMFATFPAGLVIYWAWNNTLSVAQQWYIMKRHGKPTPAPAKT